MVETEQQSESSVSVKQQSGSGESKKISFVNLIRRKNPYAGVHPRIGQS